MKLKMVGIFLCGSLRGVAHFPVSYVIKTVFLAIHLLQHLPEWAKCLTLPLPPPCLPLVRGLHSKMRWLAQTLAKQVDGGSVVPPGGYTLPSKHLPYKV